MIKLVVTDIDGTIYTPETGIKQETKDWAENEDYSIVCPDCKKELEEPHRECL